MLGVLFTTSSVYADTKVVSKVTVTVTINPASDSNPNPAPVKQVVTTYFKAGNARTEIDGGTITIYNRKDGKVYVLDPSQKTYFIQTEKEVVEPQADPFAGQRNGSLKVSSDISINPQTDKKTCAGIDTTAYVVSGTVSLGAQRSGGGSGGFGGLGSLGGFGGGGRRHGGGGGGSRSKVTKVSVSGEFWLSDMVKLPDDKKANVLPALLSSSQIQNYVFGPLSDNLGKKKDIPLDSRITVTSSSADGTQKSVTRTAETTSVTNDPLPDDLFVLPIGYSQVASPNSHS